MSEHNSQKIAKGRDARNAATWFHYGTIVSIVIPFPLLIFWFGLSMLIYAMNRHHPNPKVGAYIQKAAYRFYGVVGSLVAVGIFFPGDWLWYVIFWLLAAAILIPASVMELQKIRKDDWVDVRYDPDHH